MECLNNIVGITRQNCVCLNINQSTSISGLFLDDMTMGRIPLAATVWDCADNDITSILTRLVPDAVKEVNRRLYASFDQHQRPLVRGYNGHIPSKSEGGTLQNATTYEIKINVKPINGMVVILNTVKIKSLDVGDLFTMTQPDGIVNYYMFLNENINIKLSEPGEYTLTFTAPNTPNDATRFDCNCSGKPAWSQYLTLKSTAKDNGGNVIYNDTNYSFGFSTDISIYCDPLKNLCNLDFKNDVWALNYANTVLMTARKNLAAWLISSGKVTSYLITNEENLNDIIAYNEAQIQEMINYLPKVQRITDCYACDAMAVKSLYA